MNKITFGNKSQLIGTREELAEYASIIRSISSTHLQPCAGVNFLDGKPVGGRTLTQMEADRALEIAKKAGATVEEINHA
jgi:hypothetical protein